MATVYKTPGVYIEEIPKLPPSVAQVETAIPAFVGYTQMAKQLAADDLLNKPLRIGSLVEFEQFFGKGPSPSVTEVNLDSNNNFLSAKVSNTYFMYDSLRMFYANGGGDCYIVSVGKYPAAISKAQLKAGLQTLEKEDEPTILLFPDAVTLNEDDLAEVQQEALLQCSKLQDRVGLFDLRHTDPKGLSFRNKIGINHLKYGMAYTPWLKVRLPRQVKYTDISGAGIIKRSGIAVPLAALTSDPLLTGIVDNLADAYTDITTINAATNALQATGNLMDGFAGREADFRLLNNDANLQAIVTFAFAIVRQVERYTTAAQPTELQHPTLKAAVVAGITSTFDGILAKIVAIDKEVDNDIPGYAATDITTFVTAGTWPLAVAAVLSGTINEGTEEATRLAALNALLPLADALNQAYLNLVVNAAAKLAADTDNNLAQAFPVYKNILAGVANSMTVLPPSGAVAGVYALVDRTRGVWKAPANVSINSVIGPDTSFTATELDALNVDAVAGKSINAIRSFTGKGTLVFGARTLAGNDNEWRYVSVRRFFNMVEESCKKATEPFVFEPNDSNTWVKVQGMIENFLTILWRQGALQGAKPEHAFYVAVGLGKTMTALDILEGRMIVEVGMAVVRPAEFIILQFSHKMAES